MSPSAAAAWKIRDTPGLDEDVGEDENEDKDKDEDEDDVNKETEPPW